MALYNTKSAICNDYEVFVEELCKTLIPLSSGMEVQMLLCLRQDSISVCQFAAEFCTFAMQLSWGDDALCSTFKEGLASYIRDEMMGKEAPKSLNDAIEQGHHQEITHFFTVVFCSAFPKHLYQTGSAQCVQPCAHQGGR